MIFIVYAYFFAIFLTFFIKNVKINRVKPLPKIKIIKSGLVFFSFFYHKIYVGDVKLIKFEGLIYLKKSDKIMVIKNIEKVFLKNEYLFFKGMGKVHIILNCKNIFRQFNLEISSPNFDVELLKERAINELINNLFDYENCKLVKRYLFLVENIFNINANEKSLIVKQNKYFLSFSLSYRVKNCYKTVKFNQKV